MADVDRAVFYERVSEAMNDTTAAPNAFIFTASKYSRLMQDVKDAQVKKRKYPRDYRLMKRYDIIQTPDGERLAMSKLAGQETQQIFVKMEEIYDVIRGCHLKLNHGGRTRMMIALKPTYKNITTRLVNLYLSLCPGCKNKVKQPPRKYADGETSSSMDTETTEDPLQSEVEDNNSYSQASEGENVYPELFSRSQFDILDVASKDEPYKHLLIYRDLVTRYVHLKPLQSTKIDECVDALLEIFLVFGAPNILQSKNGITVTTQVCRRLCTLFPDIKVASAVADPKQKFKRQTNEEVLKLLGDRLKQNNSQKWYQCVKYVQCHLNNTFIQAICRTPSEAVFGCNPKKGIASCMSKEECDHIWTEEELKIALEKRESKTEPLLLEETLVPSGNFIKIEAEDDCADDDSEFL